MTKHAAHIHESRLALILDAREVWLHHDNPASSLQSTHVLERTLPLTGIVHSISACIETGHAHGWLDDPSAGDGRRPRTSRVQPSRRYNRNTAIFEVPQVALIRVPSQDRRRVREV